MQGKRQKLLVITCRDDAHADHLIDACNLLGLAEEVLRLNTEDFVDNCVVSFDGKEAFIRFRDSKRFLRTGELGSVWYRRPKDPELLDEQDPGIKDWIAKQSLAFLRGLYFCCHDSALWVNPLPALHRARHKLQQLTVASRLGFNVPRTCVTNDPQLAINFSLSAAHKLCTKSLDEPNYRLNGRLYPFLTRVLSGPGELADHAKSIERCPILLQEYIEKRADIRVICVGTRLFSVEISSQEHPLARDDFRGVSPESLKHEEHHLPNDIADRVIQFVLQQGLQFSALDFALSTKGEYYFLENNPNGQWLWLEHAVGVPITGALRSLLLEHEGVLS